MTRISVIGAAGIAAIILIGVVVVMWRNNHDPAWHGASREFFGTRTYDTSGGQEMRPDWNK